MFNGFLNPKNSVCVKRGPACVANGKRCWWNGRGLKYACDVTLLWTEKFQSLQQTANIVKVASPIEARDCSPVLSLWCSFGLNISLDQPGNKTLYRTKVFQNMLVSFRNIFTGLAA